MEVWVVGNQKGGVGKTTLSVNLQGVLSQAGVKTIILDQDPQQASMNWARRRCKEFEIDDAGVLSWIPALNKEVLDKIEEEYSPDLLLVDLPAGVLGASATVGGGIGAVTGMDLRKSPAPSIRPEALAALDLADLVLVPMSTTKLDTDSSVQFLAALKKQCSRQNQKGVKQSYLVVMNRVATDNVEVRVTRQTINALRGLGHPVASRWIPAYKSYNGPMWKGRSCADHNVAGRNVLVDLICDDIAPISSLDLTSKDYRFIRPSKLSLEG